MTRPLVRIYITYVSIIPESLMQIPEKDIENEAREAPKIRATYRLQWPADVPCAGITLRVQAYSACSTSHVLMTPGDIFQHCASARDFGAQMCDLECGDVILSRNHVIS